MKVQPLIVILLALSVLAFAVVNPVHAQILYTLESPNPDSSGWFGRAVSDAGDVDNDGYADLIVGAEGEALSPLSKGRAYVFSGNGGNLLHTFEYPSPGGNIHIFIAHAVSGAGDLNSDGCDDFLVAIRVEDHWMMDPWAAGSVAALSGATGQCLYSWGGPVNWVGQWDGFGWSAGGAGDVNADAHDDVIVGHRMFARAYVMSGSDGARLDTLVSPNPESSSFFSCSVSGLGDANGDGCDDVLVGASAEDAGATSAGRAYLFSGADASVLHTLVSANPESAGRFGCLVSSVADVDADGHDDIIVGAYREDGGATDAGRAYIFSGYGGQLLYTLVSPYPESGGRFGSSGSGAGDVNADGYGDVVVGAYREDGGAPDAGRAYVFSGNGGSLLYVLESSYAESAGYFGYSVSGGGDMNGDGRSEVIVGAYGEDGGATNAGRVYVFNGIEVPVELCSFTAEALSGGVLLRWTTQTEQDNYGFHLYRATSEPTDYVKITNDIVPGAGTSTVPYHYSYTDRAVEAGATYFYKLADVDVQGNQTFHGPVSVTVEPVRFALLRSHPNPFSQTTTIRLSLAAPGQVSLKIYNSAGDLVRTLADGEITVGTHDILWNGCDDTGQLLPQGSYTCRLEDGGQTQSRRLVLVR